MTLVYGRQREDRKTFAELLESVRLGAGRLAAQGVAPGDRVLVSLSTSWPWFDAWLGALWLGALPVATAPGASSADLRRLGGVIDSLGGARVVAGSQVAREARELPERAVVEAILTPEALAATSPVEVSPILDI